MGNPQLSRRRLLFTAGSGVLGVAVLNPLTGCSPSRTSKQKAPAGPSPDETPGPGAADWHRIAMSSVSAYLLIRGDEVALVDLGLPGSDPAIEAALKAAGTGYDKVRHIVLTHMHPDHVGGLEAIGPKVGATIYAGAADLGGIASDKVLSPVKDGDEVFGLQIIGTPGHTVGHISVFDPSTGVLVAGDALRTTGGLVGSDPQYTADPIDADDSVRKLAKLDVKAILPGHGDPLLKGASAELRKLAASLPTH
jgi:glyoxylase-like metal-dependent hydrolase (beta-lactamase superfamily II)